MTTPLADPLDDLIDEIENADNPMEPIMHWEWDKKIRLTPEEKAMLIRWSRNYTQMELMVFGIIVSLWVTLITIF